MNFKAKLLKKSLIVLVLLLVAGTAFAANGETLNIGGTVPLSLTLTVTPDAAVDNLPLDATDLSTTQNVAAVAITTNNSAGWEFYIYSTNGGKMINADGNEIAYTLTYASAESTGVANTAPAAAGTLFASEGDATGDSAGDLDITYLQSTSYPAGYYSDQLTMVLRAQ